MKKQIVIEGEALASLKNILDQTKYANTAEARKQHTCHMCMEKSVSEFVKAMHEVENAFLKPLPNDSNKLAVERDQRDNYDAARIKVMEHKYTVLFDFESFALIKRYFDNLFERPEIKDKGGMEGLDQARNINQILTAFENVKDVA